MSSTLPRNISPFNTPGVERRVRPSTRGPNTGVFHGGIQTPRGNFYDCVLCNEKSSKRTIFHQLGACLSSLEDRIAALKTPMSLRDQHALNGIETSMRYITNCIKILEDRGMAFQRALNYQASIGQLRPLTGYEVQRVKRYVQRINRAKQVLEMSKISARRLLNFTGKKK
ncbi:MAG: hypothetical protein CMA10_04630 [Euryarchaeota archaeon]|nr:hypothetical protein [Euryarchaeota archaeon]